MSGIFGGSKSKSKSQQTSQSLSYNQAYPQISTAYTPQLETGRKANDAISNLLGLGTDPAAANAAFDDYKGSTGYNFRLGEGQKAITGSNAARGMLNSGATLKALQGYGQNLASQEFGNYLSQLLGLTQQGNTAGQLIAGTGQYSSSYGQGTSDSTSKSKPGLGGVLGGVLSGIPSDPRLKVDAELVGQLPSGIDIYEYRYIWEPETAPKRRGVMADQVAEIQPEALGDEIGGYYMSVRYDLLEGWEG